MPQDQQRHAESAPTGSGLIPPAVRISPSSVPKAPPDVLTPDFMSVFEGKDVPFWRPGPLDLLRYISLWKWLMMLPAMGLALGLPLAAILPGAHQVSLYMNLFKLWLFSIGVIITIILGAARRGVAARRDPFCIHCGYSLEGMDKPGRCPECGYPYVLGLAEEYRRDPHFFRARWKALRSHPSQTPFRAGDGPTPDDGAR